MDPEIFGADPIDVARIRLECLKIAAAVGEYDVAGTDVVLKAQTYFQFVSIGKTASEVTIGELLDANLHLERDLKVLASCEVMEKLAKHRLGGR